MRWSWWVIVVSLTSWAETRVFQRGLSGHIPRAQRRPPLRVYKGQEDTHGIYPYVVALLDVHSRVCTGTLITSNWVLTAAHCTGGDWIAIQYGNTSLRSYRSKNKKKVLTTVLHPNEHIDIALLKVEPVHMRAYGNVSALDYIAMTGRAVQYAGYGSTYNLKTKNRDEVSNHDETRPLQMGEGVIVPCRGDTAVDCKYLNVAPKCTNKEQDTLPGDSGCPLFHDGKIVGVLMGGLVPPVSWFTPVSPYLPWIKAAIAANGLDN